MLLFFFSACRPVNHLAMQSRGGNGEGESNFFLNTFQGIVSFGPPLMQAHGAVIPELLEGCAV